MRRLCSYCDRTVYAMHVVSFSPIGKESAAQIISSLNKSILYATHKIFFRSMSIDFATQICLYWVEKITFAMRMRFFPIRRYRYATRIVIFHSGRLWFASGFYLCGARGLEILAGMIYAEALGLKNRPKTGIPDGRGLKYSMRMACDETRGMVTLVGMGFSESWGRWKLRALFLSFFLLFLSWLGKRRQKKVKPPQGAVSLLVVGRGRGILTRIGFFYLLGRWKLKVLSIDIFTR